MKQHNRRLIGAQGEEQAYNFLKKSGYKILARNFRSLRGEIDLVAKSGNDIVFVEVKLRHSRKFGLPQEAVNRTKQRRIIVAALAYMKQAGLTGQNMRFDVLAIGPEPGTIELLQSAFTATDQSFY